MIKQLATKLGFFACGISRAESLTVEHERLKKWVAEELHGDMNYLAWHTEKRSDPRQVLENARSVISLLYNYNPAHPLPEANNLRIARYAAGKDYHVVIKQKLDLLIGALKQWCAGASAVGFVDVAPVMEKALAQRAGLGWIGKNMLLIHPQSGSYFFIGDIITDVELEVDKPHPDQCGDCRRCLDACPTGALTAPYRLDARRCISYLTNSYRGELPTQLQPGFQLRIYGCDACQEACPYNRFAIPNPAPELIPVPGLMAMNRTHWQKLTEKEFHELFENSTVKKITYPMLKRNIDFVCGTTQRL
ncbi:MAG: tRNA epoxyqueuosine(34) reductase QueG [Bacteroidales bacterium]|nr:tRNA epoxyqueuosine(34) reductase QueG [Lentimicrobiaceae bacterium]MDD5694106.1 tRNA epoxyqueuosine(34) reductase QueG [Bacteroidales bacterium]